MFIPSFHSNITLVVARTGDTDPYTTAIGASWTGEGAFDTAAADALAVAFRTAALPNLSTADTLVSVDFDYNEASGVLTYSSVQGQVGTGQPGSATVPQNTAALFQKRTSTPGRKGRGRMYWPYVGEADVDAVGTLTSAAQTRYGVMLTAWRQHIVTSAFWDEPVLFHETSTPDPSPITAITVSPTVASQRRRLRR